MNKLPNGWSQPTFLSVDEGGALNIEWCFDWGRILFVWQPGEGVMACKTIRSGDQESCETDSAAKVLAGWLDAASSSAAGKDGGQ